MNHKRGKLVLLFLLLALSMTGCDSFIKEVPVQQSEEQESIDYTYPISADLTDEGLHVDATYGFNRIAKQGRDMQVKVTVKNEGPAFEGKVNIEIPGLATTESYQKKVEIQSNESNEYVLTIPITQENMYFTIQLLNEDGKTLMSGEAKANAPSNMDLVYVGILADSDDSVDSLSKSNLKVIPLQTADIPTKSVGMDSIDVLMIGEFQIDQLSKEQIATIKEWVRLGGSLVLSNTTENAKVIESFSSKDFYGLKDINDQKLKGKAYRIVDAGNSYSLEKVSYAEVIEIGLGNVQFLPYSFLKEDTNNVAAKKQIIAAIVKHVSNFKSNQLKTEYMQAQADVTAALNNMNAEYVTKVPKVTYYVVILLLYIIIIGPVVYLILRRKDRRIYIWGIIPVLSVVFVAVVYVLGTSTRIKEPYVRYLTVLNVADSGYTAEHTLFTVSTPDEGTVSTTLEGDYDITSLQNQRALSNYTKEPDTKNIYDINIQNDADVTEITLKKLSAFEPLYFKVSDSYQLTPPDTTLNYANYKLTGEFTNRFDFQLSNAVILTTNTIVDVGDVNPGETVKVSNKDFRYAASYDTLYSKEMEKYLSRVVGYGKQYQSNLEYLQVTARKKIMESYVESWLMNNHTANYLIAFDYTDRKSDILNAFDYASQGYRLIVLSLDTGNQIDDMTEFIPDITSYMKVLEGDYYEELSMIQGDELVVQYAFGKDRISSVEYSSYFNSEFSPEAWAGFFGEAWFYNYKTKQYDQKFKSGEACNIEDLSMYLNDKNVMKAKYVVDPDYQNNYVIYVPKLTAIKEVQEDVTN